MLHIYVCGGTLQVRTARAFLRDVTPVSPAALLLFGGGLEVKHEEGAVVVGGWARCAALPFVCLPLRIFCVS